jgi:capsular exopolysaccharide synthesis family protein
MLPAQAQSGEISLHDLIEILRRRKMVILQVVLVVVTVGALLTFLTKPTYRAMTRLLVEGKALAITQIDGKDPLSALFTAPAGYDVATQMEVLLSEKVVDEAYKRAGVNARQVKVSAKQVNDTNVIELRVDSQQPDFAIKLAQTLPDTYLKYITGNRKGEISNALAFARARLNEEEQKLQSAEKAMEQFQKNQKLVDLDQERKERLTQTSSAQADVRRAEADVAAAKAKYDSLLRARNALPAVLETPTVTSNHVQRSALEEKITTLQAERQRTLVLFKEGSPEIAKIDAQLAEYRSKLNALPETMKTFTKTPNPALLTYADKIAEAKATLEASLAQLQQVRGRLPGVTSGMDRFTALERQQSRLQREIERRLGTVNSLAKSVEDLALRDRAHHDPVLVITPALTAEQVGPRLMQNLLMALLFGLVLGISLGLLQEYLDDHIHSVEEARQLLGANALGYVPLVKGEQIPLLTEDPGHHVLESYRVLRSNVQFATIDQPICSLQITSSQSGEGKSTTACNMAVAMALDGKKVILVDADLRLPTIHTKLGLPQYPGLTNVLLNRATLQEALKETSIPGLWVLPAGTLPPNPAELLNSRAMRDLHTLLVQEADVVIFDSPPTLATADAQVLSAHVDGVVYVMQVGTVQKSAVRHAAEMLAQAHARVLGIVFNKMEMTSGRDNYYYYGYGSSYYGTNADSKEMLHGKNGHEGNGKHPESLLPASQSSVPAEQEKSV